MQPCNRIIITKFIEGSTCFEWHTAQFGAPDDERFAARNMLNLQ